MPTKLENFLSGVPTPSYTPNWLVCPNIIPIPIQNNNCLIPSPIYSDYFSQNQGYFLVSLLPERENNSISRMELGDNEILAVDADKILKDNQKKKKEKSKQIRVTRVRRHKKNELENIKDWDKDRNILSNSLKLFLKQLRLSLKEVGNHPQEIIHKLCLEYGVKNFEERLNELLPSDLNYIRPNTIKDIIESECKEFSRILEISLRKFFKETIYLSLSKSTQIRRSIKQQQIKAGRKLLEYFFGQEKINEKK